MYDLIVIGAGAAGVFSAIQAKTHNKNIKIAILEKTLVPLAKVKISGGGRCNVTHACFDPKKLVTFYPRGFKELLGPFHRFQPKDTIEWFERHHVKLKTEEDGRIFPVSDRSETIIQCFLSDLERLQIELHLKQKIEKVFKEHETFVIETSQNRWEARHLLIATGSSLEGYEWAKAFGHSIVSPVPSLFTFNVPSSPLKDLSGVSAQDVCLRLKESSYEQRGPLLITHFGFSGPAALKLSAWAARYLFEKKYQTTLSIDWLPDQTEEETYQYLLHIKQKFAQKTLLNETVFSFPKSLWKFFLGSSSQKKGRDFSHKELRVMAYTLHHTDYLIEGKTTHKEEFVTCGGVCLNEINFKTMESLRCPHLFFAGEVLNIDGVTGGFNFQASWTTGAIVGENAFA